LKKERRHWSADDKIRLLRLHLIEKQAISKICEEASLSPMQFYAWQEQLFANGSAALACFRCFRNVLRRWRPFSLGKGFALGSIRPAERITPDPSSKSPLRGSDRVCRRHAPPIAAVGPRPTIPPRAHLAAFSTSSTRFPRRESDTRLAPGLRQSPGKGNSDRLGCLAGSCAATTAGHTARSGSCRSVCDSETL